MLLLKLWGRILCGLFLASGLSLSHVQLFETPWTAAHQASLSFTISWSLLKLVSIESMMPSNHLIVCHPLLLLPSIFPSIRVFSSESALRIRWPKYWSFSISPSSEYSGLISFRIDWFDLLVVQGTLKSLLQYHSSKASVLQHSAFFMVQLNFMVQHGKPYNKSKSFCPPVSILPTCHWSKKVMLQPDTSMMGIDDPPATMFLNDNVNYYSMITQYSDVQTLYLLEEYWCIGNAL